MRKLTVKHLFKKCFYTIFLLSWGNNWSSTYWPPLINFPWIVIVGVSLKRWFAIGPITNSFNNCVLCRFEIAWLINDVVSHYMYIQCSPWNIYLYFFFEKVENGHSIFFFLWLFMSQVWSFDEKRQEEKKLLVYGWKPCFYLFLEEVGDLLRTRGPDKSLWVCSISFHGSTLNGPPGMFE